MTKLCVYCSWGHTSSSCKTVTTRREILHKSDRCYTCLKKYHFSKDCLSRLKCWNCSGRHYIMMCSRNVEQDSSHLISSPAKTTSGGSDSQPSTTNSFYTSTRNPVLLTHCKAFIVQYRAILDNSSQWMYIPTGFQNELSLPTVTDDSFARVQISPQTCSTPK